jgi:hypothetical protein
MNALTVSLCAIAFAIFFVSIHITSSVLLKTMFGEKFTELEEKLKRATQHETTSTVAVICIFCAFAAGALTLHSNVEM